MKYEKVKIDILHIDVKDIITTSPETEWEDENADDNGWL